MENIITQTTKTAKNRKVKAGSNALDSAFKLA